jgi:hypothetical protein
MTETIFLRKLNFVAGEQYLNLQSLDGLTTVSSPVLQLFSSQEEADTRIVLHCQYASSLASAETCIIVRSPDTDVLVILLYYCSSVVNKLLFYTGVGSHRWIIDSSSIYRTLGSATCAALPQIHAYTGSDFTSSFVRRGKIRPFQLVQKGPVYVDVFAALGNSALVDEDAMTQIERFVCAMYGKTAYSDVYKLHHGMIKTRYQPKSADKVSMFDDGLDLSLLPRYRDALHRHILCANYVALTWKQSHIPHAQLPPAT